MRRRLAHGVIELEHRRRRLTEYLACAVQIFKGDLQRPVDNCNLRRVDGRFTHKPVRHVQRQFLLQQVRRIELFKNRRSQRKPRRAHHPAQHRDHITHGRAVKGHRRVTAQAQATHQVVTTNAQRDNTPRQLFQHGTAQFYHRPRIKHLRGFKGRHQHQLAARDRLLPLADITQAQFGHHKAIDMAHQ